MITPDVGKKVGIASLIMMASVFLSRLMGVAREMVIARAGGASGEVDAYLIAFMLPEILNHIAASGFLSITFVPIFTGYLADDNEAGGWQIFSTIMTLFGAGLLLLILASMVFAPHLVYLMAPGRDDPLLVQKAVTMTRIILPAQFFFFAGGLLMAVQYARESFLIPALMPLIYNAGIIAGGLLLAPRLGMAGFSWGVLAGAFIGGLLVQVWGARRVGMRYTPRFDARHPDVWQYLVLTLPLMVGLTMTFSTEFFLKFFGSFLDAGGIAALNYALRVMFLVVGLFGQAVGVASYPFLAQMAAENRRREMNALIDNTLRYLSAVIPFSILMMLLRVEIITVLFQRGAFDRADTLLTARALLFLLVGAFAFAAQTVVVRGYYALKNTLFPAVFGTLAVGFSLPLYWIGLRWFHLAGVAMAISLSAMLQVFLLYGLWNRKSGNTGAPAVYGAMMRMTAVGIAAGALTGWAKLPITHLLPNTSLRNCLTIAVMTTAIFMVLIYGITRIWRIPELDFVITRIGGRIRRQPRVS